MAEILKHPEIKAVIDSILSITEIKKVEWDGNQIRCFRDTTKQIATTTIHVVAIKMEELKYMCKFYSVSPFSEIAPWE